MKRVVILIVSVALLLSARSAFAWGNVAHKAIADIAENHLTPEVKEKVRRYLDGPLAKEAVWMDRVAFWAKKHWWYIPGWEQLSYSHTMVVDEKFRPSDKRAHSGGGNLLPTLKECIENLRNHRNLTDSAVVVNLKCVIHMVGDMHCPSHIYFTEFPDCFALPKSLDPEKKGRKARDRMIIYYNGKKMNYHHYWDQIALTELYPEYGKDYEKFSFAFDTAKPKKRAKICKGSIDDWVYDIAKSCRPLYNGIKAGDHIGKEYVESTGKLAQWQCAKAGYRLAHILNETMK